MPTAAERMAGLRAYSSEAFHSAMNCTACQKVGDSVIVLALTVCAYLSAGANMQQKQCCGGFSALDVLQTDAICWLSMVTYMQLELLYNILNATSNLHDSV